MDIVSKKSDVGLNGLSLKEYISIKLNRLIWVDCWKIPKLIPKLLHFELAIDYVYICLVGCVVFRVTLNVKSIYCSKDILA
jgi:hypothetical protein